MTTLPSLTGPANSGQQLLHRVIIQSGSAMEEWTLDNNSEESFLNTAAVMNCNATSNKKTMVRCMRKADYVDVAKASLSIYVSPFSFFFPLVKKVMNVCP